MNTKNLFNEASFRALLESPKERPEIFAVPRGVTVGDAAYSGTLLARSLTVVDPTIFTKQYPDLSFILSGIQANNTGGYANRIQSLRRRGVGGFKTAGDMSVNKGHISLTAEDSYLTVIERHAESLWTDTEIKQAEMQGVNLVSDYLATHSEIYMREVDEIGLVGVDGRLGLLNSAFSTTTATTTALLATGVQLYNDIARLLNLQHNAVRNTASYKANVVMLPTSVFNIASNKIMDTSAGPMSVLTALKGNFPGVTFIDSFRAESVSGTSRAIAFSNNPESMVMRIPQPLTIGEVIKVGSFDFKVDSKYRIAGLDVLEGTSGYLMTGL